MDGFPGVHSCGLEFFNGWLVLFSGILLPIAQSEPGQKLVVYPSKLSSTPLALLFLVCLDPLRQALCNRDHLRKLIIEFYTNVNYLWNYDLDD